MLGILPEKLENISNEQKEQNLNFISIMRMLLQIELSNNGFEIIRIPNFMS